MPRTRIELLMADPQQTQGIHHKGTKVHKGCTEKGSEECETYPPCLPLCVLCGPLCLCGECRERESNCSWPIHNRRKAFTTKAQRSTKDAQRKAVKSVRPTLPVSLCASFVDLCAFVVNAANANRIAHGRSTTDARHSPQRHKGPQRMHRERQ